MNIVNNYNPPTPVVALDRALQLAGTKAANNGVKVTADMVLEDAEKFRRFLTGTPKSDEGDGRADLAEAAP